MSATFAVLSSRQCVCCGKKREDRIQEQQERARFLCSPCEGIQFH